MTDAAQEGGRTGAPAGTRLAAYTWSRQWKSEVFTGIVAGATALASFAAVRSLGAPDWTPQLLAVAGQIPWLFAPGLEAFTSRLDARRAFVWLGILANVPLLLVAFLPVTPLPDGHGAGAGPWPWFVAAIVVLTALDGLYIPLRGALIRANYAEELRGRFFGRLSAVSKSATIASSKLGGLLLGHDPRLLRVVYPLAGAAGIVEHVILSRIRWHRAEAVRPRATGLAGHFAESLRDGLGVLRRDRDFRIFEVAFLLYGLGFLMGQPLLVVHMERTLRLSYDEATWAIGFAEPVAYLAVALLVGPLLPRIGVMFVTTAAFAALSAFFIAVAFVTGATPFVLLYVLFGATMAGVNLGWHLGPMRFAPPGRARVYAAVHLLMVGVRILVAPAAGYALSRVFGERFVFGLSAVLVAAGAVTAGLLGRRVR